MTLSSEHSSTDERPLPLLIAEENAATRLTLCEQTSEWGYRAILVRNGAQVLQKLEEKAAPQIAIVSNSLPDCSGIALCRKIRDTRLAFYPFILLTSNRNDKDELVVASKPAPTITSQSPSTTPCSKRASQSPAAFMRCSSDGSSPVKSCACALRWMN